MPSFWLVFANRKICNNPYILVLSLKNEEAEKAVLGLLDKSVEYYTVKSKTINAMGIEMTCELRTKDATTAFVNRIHDIENVDSTTLVSYNGEYMS